jgi:hypothetical protein
MVGGRVQVTLIGWFDPVLTNGFTDTKGYGLGFGRNGSDTHRRGVFPPKLEPPLESTGFGFSLSDCKDWSGREDSNLRPPGPEPYGLDVLWFITVYQDDTYSQCLCSQSGCLSTLVYLPFLWIVPTKSPTVRDPRAVMMEPEPSNPLSGGSAASSGLRSSRNMAIV